MRKPEFVYVTYIETTPEKLWQALTDPDFTQRYWFGMRLRSDWSPGSTFEMVRSDGRVSDAGQVVEVDPPRRLSYTFVNLSEEYRGERAALATFTLEPHGKVVKLTLTHEGFDDGGKMLKGISKGWPAILSGLKSVLETGKALAIPSDALKTARESGHERHACPTHVLHHLHRGYAGNRQRAHRENGAATGILEALEEIDTAKS